MFSIYDDSSLTVLYRLTSCCSVRHCAIVADQLATVVDYWPIIHMRSVMLLAAIQNTALKIKRVDTWSEGKETQLIDLWREHPCLFDCSSKCYSNRNTNFKVMVLYSVFFAIVTHIVYMVLTNRSIVI